MAPANRGRIFARRVFMGAGIYGLLALLPQYFLEVQIGRDYPPPITHPEYFYGFVGVAVAWQVAFLIIARDVVRFRPLMLAAIVEKASFALPTFVLFAGGRVAAATTAAASIDLLLGVLFVAAYRACRPDSRPA